ncbi:MAG: hypothetical protein H0V97_05090 [Actinobacteria bacterium]|nr:hypothetical protein [Actinomycetota bacterium]
MNLRRETKHRDGLSGTTRRRPGMAIAAGLALTMVAGGLAQMGIGLAASNNSAAAGAGRGERRVDLARPKFSDPTSITNPLFPISELEQVIQLGQEGGDPLRIEVTLLPRTKTIKWNGQRVETLVSQFIAYLDGRVLETAVDYFAQADDGSVWYFGEKVNNYENGVIANHEGTWLAGKDGPPGMIMPADPKVGDIYRPENIPGFVFEEVTVKAVDQTVDGPRGPVEGAIRVEELLMDGTTEDKIFAPGYGEFLARAEDELVTVALAVPIDALSGPLSAELGALWKGAVEIFDATPARDWDAISGTLDSMIAAWDAYQVGDYTPELLDEQMTSALDELTSAVEMQRPVRARYAAVEVGIASADFQLRYRAFHKVDFDRIELYSRRLLVDNAGNRMGDVAGDVAVIETIWDRIARTVGGKA